MNEKPRIDSVEVTWKRDETPDPSYLEQEGLGFEERLVAYQRGEFHFVGVTAKATVSYPVGQGHRRLEWLTSVGLWGIKSDMDDTYREELEQEQLDDLRDHLARFGIKWDGKIC